MTYDGPHFPTGSCVVNRGCRREECRAARTRRVKKSKYDAAHGREWTVPPDRARERARWLRDSGMEIKAIARTAGVAKRTVEELLEPVPPRKRIYRRVETAILGVLPIPGGRAHIDATVAYRQLQALYALGYSHRWLYVTGHFGPEIHPARPRPTLEAQLVVKIADLAARIGDNPGPSQICRDRAAAKGWLVPAWYDENWEPSTLLGGAESDEADRTESATVERRELIRELALRLYGLGVPVPDIARRAAVEYGRFGTNPRTIARIVRAAGLTGRREAG